MADEEASGDPANPRDPFGPLSKSHAASVDVRELAGPPGLPGPLYDPPPKMQDGTVDWVRLHHVLEAVENLLRAGMIAHARAVVTEAKTIVTQAMPRCADVVDLRPRSR